MIETLMVRDLIAKLQRHDQMAFTNVTGLEVSGGTKIGLFVEVPIGYETHSIHDALEEAREELESVECKIDELIRLRGQHREELAKLKVEIEKAKAPEVAT